jgi:hypothetical protein
MKKTLIFALAVVSVSVLVGCIGKKENEAEQAKRLAPFVPEGYAILSKTAGNLNLDKFEDMLLIVERKEETIGEEWIEEDRILMILLGQKGGKYEFAAKNDKAVFHSNAGGAFTDEPLDSAGIKDGEFSVRMMGGSTELWTRTITFKYSAEDKNWYLYSDEETVIDRLDPDNACATLRMVEDFGRVSFAQFDLFEQYGQSEQTAQTTEEVDFKELTDINGWYLLNNKPFTGIARSSDYGETVWTIKDGIIQGPYSYDNDGCGTYGNYKNGKKDGEWTNYCLGETATEIYEDGELKASDVGVYVGQPIEEFIAIFEKQYRIKKTEESFQSNYFFMYWVYDNDKELFSASENPFDRNDKSVWEISIHSAYLGRKYGIGSISADNNYWTVTADKRIVERNTTETAAQATEALPIDWYGIDFENLTQKGDLYYLNNVPFTGKAGYQRGEHASWEFKDGKFNGEYTFYFDGCGTNGNYKNGKKDGKWISSCGGEETIEIWKDDELISEIYKDKDGELISE